MADKTSPLVWGAVAALLTVTVAGAAYTLRRRGVAPKTGFVVPESK